MALDLDAARAWLAEHLPEGETVVFSDESTLERAAAVIRSQPASNSEAA